eukprot:UN11167
MIILVELPKRRYENVGSKQIDNLCDFLDMVSKVPFRIQPNILIPMTLKVKFLKTFDSPVFTMGVKLLLSL